jgi:HK97 family phage portal protein
MAELDLVDMMGGPRNVPAPTRSGELVVTKSHSEPMSMNEFVQWVSNTFGTIGVKEALQQTAFLLCCDVIAQDMAKATLRLRERLTATTSRVVMPEQHPVAAFYAMEPNRRHTWPEFKEMMGLWGCLTENAFAVLFRNRAGDIQEVVPVQSGRVTEKISGRDIFYDVTAGTLHEQALLGQSFLTVPERDMIHVRGRMLDGMYGYSTLLVGKTTLETGKAIEDYRNQLFGEDGQIRGVFVRDKELDPLPEEVFQRFKAQMRALMMGVAKNNDPIVLEGGIKFERLSVNPEEAELSKQFEAQINATCRLLRVPPHKIFQLDGSKYENLETMEKAYVGDTMIPVCLRFERRYDRAFLSPKERLRFFTEHDRDEMTIKDTKAETERVIKAVERGVIEIDEARAKLGYNELPNGQGKTRLIPVNMRVVDESGKIAIEGKAGKSGNGAGDDTEDADSETGGETKMIRLVASKD